MNNSSIQLEKEPVGKLLAKFSVPAITGMLVNALYQVIDRIFIGKIDSLAMAGVSVTLPFAPIIMAFGMLVGVGAGALTSIKLGQKKKEEAEVILGNSFVLNCLISVLVTFFSLLFLDPLLNMMGASENTLPYAKEYITIILGGSILQNIAFGMNALIRAEGNPTIAMLTMLLGAVINTLLDYIFVIKLGFGIKGAAYATIIAQGISSLWVISYLTGGKTTLKLKIKNFALKKEIILGIFAIGISPFAMQLAASVVTAISNKSLLHYGGDLAVGAMAVISSVVLFISMPIFGLNQGSQPIIGYNYGAKKYKRVKKTLGLAIFIGTTISVLGFLMVQLFPEFIVTLFNEDKELVNIGSKGIRLYLIMLPVIGIQIISANYFQAIGKAKMAMILSLLRQVIILIPLLLTLPYFWGLNGVWLSAPISDFTSALITIVFIVREMKNLKAGKEKEQNTEEFYEEKLA